MRELEEDERPAEFFKVCFLSTGLGVELAFGFVDADVDADAEADAGGDVDADVKVE